MRLLVDLLLPTHCAACGSGEDFACAACRANLERLAEPLCARCGAATAWPVQRCRECAGRRLGFATARAAVAYEGPARALVVAWKEKGIRTVAGIAADLVLETVPRPPARALTFIPGDPDRVRWRGTNTAGALAAALGKRWELPVLDLLGRTRRVRPQRRLPRAERRANVQAAFSAAPAPAALALVDDVYTTGATVSAAATELRRAGARTVHVVTFARAVRR